MNKPIYLDLSKKERSCYMDTGSFIVYIKTEDIHIDIAKDVVTRFDISN